MYKKQLLENNYHEQEKKKTQGQTRLLIKLKMLRAGFGHFLEMQQGTL